MSTDREERYNEFRYILTHAKKIQVHCSEYVDPAHFFLLVSTDPDENGERGLEIYDPDRQEKPVEESYYLFLTNPANQQMAEALILSLRSGFGGGKGNIPHS